MNDALKKEIVGFIESNPPPEGWCVTDKALAMSELIIETKPNKVVEIGVFGGRSLVPQAMALKENGQGRIYGIDAWRRDVAIEGDNTKENDEWWIKLDIEYIHRHCMENIFRNQVERHAAILRCTSQDCVELFEDIDILHIDGAHSEVASVRDVVNYLPKVLRGGYIWFDDVDWPTTAKAIALVSEHCDYVKSVGACNLYRKR